MRRHHLSKLGFNTGSPFTPAPRISPHEWQLTFGGKHGSVGARSPSSSVPPSRSGSSSAAQSPTTPNGVSGRGVSQASPARRRGEGVGGQLDAGRLAAARLVYERAGSAPHRSTAAARSAAVAAAASATVPAAASSSSTPVSRRTSVASAAPKRRRDDASEDERDDDASSRRSSDAENDPGRTPNKRRKSGKQASSAGAAAAADSLGSSQPPPLETAAGNPVAVDAHPPSSSSSADAFALAPPIPSLEASPPQTPTAPMDPRDKSRQMIRDALVAALQQSEAADDAAATDHSSTAAGPTTSELPAAAADTSSSSATGAAPSSAPASAPAASVGDPTRLADCIESHLFDACGGVADGSYRRKLRDLVFNMKGNAPLCMRLLHGDLRADEVVRLDYHSLASAAVAAERDRLRQENFDATVYRPPTRVDTSDYKCASCGSTRCSTLVIREERDISKADTWGSKQGAGSVIEIRCEDCKNLWTKEE